MLKKAVFLFSTLIALLSGIFIVNSTVEYGSTSNETTVSVVPLNLLCDHITDVGKTFTVNFTVADVDDMYGWEVEVYFDPTILNIKDEEVWLPPDHVFSYTPYIVWPKPVLDNDNGRLIVACSLTGDIETFFGSGTLCQVNFTAIANGIPSIEFDEEESRIVDYDVQEMPCIWINTFIDVGSQLLWIYREWWTGGTCGVVSIEPSSQVQAFVFDYPNEINFTMTLDGVDYCNISIPHLKTSKKETVWDGPFTIIVDGSRINHTVSFNATHTFLHFNLEDRNGICNIEVTEAILINVWSNPHTVGIADLYPIARHFGKSLEEP